MKHLVESSLDDDKAENIVAIDLAGKTDFADYMIVASGRSARHVQTLASKLSDRLRDEGFPPMPIEGMESGDWVLVDAGDVIVHLFRPEIREVYNLEKMWSVAMPESEMASA